MNVKRILKLTGIAGIGIAGIAAASAGFGYGICRRLVRDGLIDIEPDPEDEGSVSVFLKRKPDEPASERGCENCAGTGAVRDCGACSRNKCVGCICDESCEACPFPAGVCACHQADADAVTAEPDPDADLPEIEYDQGEDGGVPVADEDETEFVCGQVQCEGCQVCGVAQDLVEERKMVESMPDTDFEHQPDFMTEPGDDWI